MFSFLSVLAPTKTGFATGLLGSAVFFSATGAVFFLCYWSSFLCCFWGSFLCCFRSFSLSSSRFLIYIDLEELFSNRNSVAFFCKHTGDNTSFCGSNINFYFISFDYSEHFVGLNELSNSLVKLKNSPFRDGIPHLRHIYQLFCSE